ncbi:MAG: pyridoxamine 5'-phosphate oxidase family protein [Candidatus Helarchaeota archaeon]
MTLNANNKGHLSAKIVNAFQEDAAPKYLATLNKEGTPNIVPILSLDAIDQDTITFGDYMIWKTKRNLLEYNKVACAVTSMDGFQTYIVKGDFQNFVKKGELVERANLKPLFRYNAYTGVRGVGIIKVKQAYPPKKLINIPFILNILKLKIGKGKVKSLEESNSDKNINGIHHRIIEKFKGITSFKMLAYKDDDDYPMIIPISSMSPKKDGRRLVFSFSGIKDEINRIPLMSKVAISLFKLQTEKNIIRLAFSNKIPWGEIQPIAYQLKGVYQGTGKFRGVSLGVIDITEVYSASPPLPGELISTHSTL